MTVSARQKKRELRLEMQRACRAISAAEAASCGRRVAEILAAQSEFQRAPRVVTFLSLPDEISTDALISLARGSSKGVLVPRVLDDHQLEFVDFMSDTAVESSALRVREPTGAVTSVPLAAGDLLLAPGLAFDRSGGRLGRGAGYYDRALEAAAALELAVFGLAYSFQVVERVPQEAHDRRVGSVITEEGCYRVRKEGDC